MSLLDKLTNDMKEAMKQRDKDRLTVIRMLRASLQNEAIKLGVNSLNEEDELTVLGRELKQRNDSLLEFEKANRLDLVEPLKKEIAIVKRYLPEQLSEDEVDMIVQETIDALKATRADFGKVMGTVMQRVKGKADGNLVRQRVETLLK
ncbi:MAG TPA: GatB/YqeY domain-containing protein [Pseudogracilibacillus sp.]|nr:GatB/YqeY domain-containing protein [Pseudogracilibacillus sp.]